MKDLSTVLPGAVAKSLGQDPIAQVRSADLTPEQKGAIKYFYARLERIYLAEYRRQLPDESTERASKSEFGQLIMDIPKATMDKGFDALHEELKITDSQYRFMKLDPVIELIKTGGNVNGHQDGIYKPFPKALPITQEEKEKRAVAARGAINDMKELFND